MFKHIMVPTDGSRFSNKAVKQAVQFAKKVKARITGIHVVPGFHMVVDEGYAVPIGAKLKRRFEERSIEQAKKLLDGVAGQARGAGVRCQTVVQVGDLPYEEIIKQAKKRKCDLIMMASHGRRGLSGLLLGSETAKVLIHSKIPVLVVR